MMKVHSLSMPPFLYLYRGGSSVNYSIEAEILQQMQKKVYCSELCRTKNPWYTKIAEAHTGQAVTPKGVFFMPFGMKKQEESISEEVLFFCPGAFVWTLRSVSFMTHEMRIQWGIAT